MKRIVQLIPYDAIGGVEVAAKSIHAGDHNEANGGLRFERQYLVNRSGAACGPANYQGPDQSLYDPRPYLHAFWRLFRKPPDLLVASLWRSALVMILLKIARPKQKAVLFLHLAQDVHWLDRIANQIAMRLADSIWADSAATLEQRVPPNRQHKGRVISFLLNRCPLPEISEPTPEFIFWGRLSQQKGLERALTIFSEILALAPDAHFKIIGPDCGVENDLKARARQLGIAENVSFAGARSQAEIHTIAKRASFYLQTSIDEGMALSVVEAMQIGLVPVVTPVGEIARYCVDGKNAVCVQDDVTAVNTVLGLLSDTERYRCMSYAAAEYWQAKPLYQDEFLAAAKEVIEGSAANV
ncbi:MULTISPECIES: glycosyltransferase family 4 protein [unclassified Marinobacter]|jgi:glycosyltransferase involved in cell wall biosynthesis|uniref:glycosyltransferase family 4 protein n=1 Tax=unclassified Marinobacter TaxID=83889 RepID=UPI00200DED22|nr:MULTISPECIES: glycosyltransferase family 4 protein [unclassified Marinobacter]MCL1479095.1 glycosyltransferase family 4 protein [Marinobacter sp.]UQG57171.1 glycosyltransferase family 4 protein [Marinobacter sp. M4C]UQG65975.1 glycosyltransferase family 4 protein [Marinobacter sp. M2C]UQG70255.1 glycosyltransferase family 4 protein [Marinobacter sp. M1C]